MLKLKLQYFGHLMRRADSLKKTLMLGKIEGKRRRGLQKMVGWYHRFNEHEFEQTLGDSEGQGSWRAAVHGVTRSQTWLNNWTTTASMDLWIFILWMMIQYYIYFGAQISIVTFLKEVFFLNYSSRIYQSPLNLFADRNHLQPFYIALHFLPYIAVICEYAHSSNPHLHFKYWIIEDRDDVLLAPYFFYSQCTL